MADVNQMLARPWNETELGLIHTRLLNDQRKGSPTEYEIRIDGMTVVRRTDEIGDFFSYAAFVREDKPQTMEIRLYRGAGWQYDGFEFKRENQNEPAPNLSGPNDPVAEMRLELTMLREKHQLETELERQRQQHENELMRRDFSSKELETRFSQLKTDHEELLDYTDQLEEEVKKGRDKNLNLGPFHLGELGSVMLESYLKRNPGALGGIGGMLAAPAGQAQQNDLGEVPQPEANSVSFEAVDDEASPFPMELEMALEGLLTKMNEDQLRQIAQLINGMVKRPELIPTLVELSNP